jgi:RNA polymerase sigma factor (sigma-70 family)
MDRMESRLNLVDAAKSGDHAALQELLVFSQSDARRYAYKHCHASDVDDAIQESLMIVSRKVKSLKSAAAFSSWLFTVIKRECRKLSRAMFRFEPLEDDVLEAQLALRSDDSLRIDLVAALESLPVHYLEVLLLRDFEELTIAEISERVSEPVPTIKSRLHRARVLVREYLVSQ